MLELQNIHVSYGAAAVLFGVSLEVRQGENVCLLGRNGVGKSTIFKTIIGLLPVSSGTIKFNGTDITRSPIYERAKLGIAYVPDDRGIFYNLTVSENLKLAAMREKKNGREASRVFELFPVLNERLNQRAGTLSGGEQQMLSIARALITKPQLLLLDEVSEGLAPLVLEKLASFFTEFKREGTILLGEQNVKFGCNVADKVYVIDNGAVVFYGTVAQLHQSRAIREYITL